MPFLNCKFYPQQPLQGLEFLPPQTARDLIACYTSYQFLVGHNDKISVKIYLFNIASKCQNFYQFDEITNFAFYIWCYFDLHSSPC